MTIADYLAVLRARWVALLLALLLSWGAGIAIIALATPQYQASSQLFVTSGEVTTSTELAQGSTFATGRVKSYAAIITGDRVLSPAAQHFGLDEAALREQVRADAVPDTALIDITVTDTDPAQAAGLANFIADEFPAVAAAVEPPRADGKPTVTVTVTQHAMTPTVPASPVPALVLGAATLVGLLLGIIAMTVWELMRPPVRWPVDTAELVR